MADWMNQMANAVDEAEAANARAQEEVPLSQLHLQGSYMREVPVNDGRWTNEEYTELLYYIAQDLNGRDHARLQELWDRRRADEQAQQQSDMERERRRAEAAEHEAHERSIKEWDAQMKAQGLDNPALPSGPLLKVFHRSVYFQESMRPFVRMIQVLLHTHSQL